MARSLKKKTRFEVFKRDGFVCQYCGKTPPDVVLEVDHIVPVSGGGTDHIDNLLTACFDCNRGKGKVFLDVSPQPLSEKTRLLKEKEMQIKEFNILSAEKRKRIQDECLAIGEMFCVAYYPMHLTEAFLNDSVAGFLDKLPFCEVEEAMRISCCRIKDAKHAVKYFCGVCWNKIKGRR